MSKIKAAIIGTGFMGTAHLEALKRIGNVDVIAIASDDKKRAEEMAYQFDIDMVYGNWSNVVNDKQVQVIHNCTPNYLHYPINKAVIEKGKHIISEKPLTVNSSQSEELVGLAQKRGIVHAINFNYRFYPLIQQAKSLMDEGALGEIYLIHGHYLQDWLYYDTDYNWRLETEISGNSRAMADIGSHWCDLVQFITGLKIKRICADLTTFLKTRKKPTQVVETFKGKEQNVTGDLEEISITTEDAASLLLQFENGTRGVFMVSQVSAGRKNRFWIEIDGSKQALSWNQEEPNKLWLGFREKANQEVIKDPSLLSDSARQYAHYPGGHPEGYPDGLKNLFLNVYEYIRNGKTMGNHPLDFPTFEDGHWENKIVEAALQSHLERRWVDVDSH